MSKSIRKNRRGIRAAKSELKRQLDPVDYGKLRSAIREKLVPGLRDRILSTIRTLQEVRATDYDDKLYVDYLAAITGTAYQTARRWIDQDDPGLPDLVSFATLCGAAGIDTAWMLGLTAVRLPALQVGAEWLQGLVSEIDRAGNGLVGMRVEDDSMEPDIHAGDWVLIDTKDRAWDSGGLYVLALTASESGDLDSRELSLLFVDGDASTLNSLRATFQSGYKVATAGDVNEAIGLVEREHFDLIVCDQGIPQVVRQKLMQVVDEIAQGTVCLLMADSADRQVMIDALNEPHAHRVVLKPWDDKRLRQVVNESILLARKLTQRSQRSATRDGSAGESTRDEREGIPLTGRLHDQPAVLDSAASEVLGQQLDPQQHVMVVRNIVARGEGGFAVTSSNNPETNTVVVDAAHALALGIHLVGRVKLRISIRAA